MNWNKVAQQMKAEEKRTNQLDWIVKFGKFKGKPVRELLKDESYCMWLKKQHWVSSWLQKFLDETIYCDTCQDNPNGMYAGEGDYMECMDCGNGRKGESLWR
jgi:hypothetical protein